MKTKTTIQGPSNNNYFWDLQIELIQLLEEVGLSFKLSDRLPTFWLRNRLTKVTDHEDSERIDRIVFLLDEIVRERTSGNEPKHNGKKYL